MLRRRFAAWKRVLANQAGVYDQLLVGVTDTVPAAYTWLKVGRLRNTESDEMNELAAQASCEAIRSQRQVESRNSLHRTTHPMGKVPLPEHLLHACAVKLVSIQCIYTESYMKSRQCRAY